ncbi:uncharacterized protein tmco3 isoform X2 [Osmerus eperlanus]|uniref:uncharacterized protein tmco3 isoform X2 n=1 Tax=Osmerus eperlanus TaxID=29151 RepID=UPI002E1372C6
MRVAYALLCLGLVGALQRDQVAQHAIKLHRGRGAAATHGRSWVTDNCKRLAGLIRHKNAVVRKLGVAADAVGGDRALSEPERLFQVHTLEIFQKELNESERSVFQAVVGLQRALQGDYRDVVNMKESSRQRLEALREAAIKEEQEYLELVAAEKHQQEALKSALAQNKTLSMLDEILEDVRRAADRLEEEIEEHAFDYNKQMKGVNVEAVLRVEDDEKDGGKRKNVSRRREVEDDLGLSMLIDSQNNQYVLTKPGDSTMPRADHHFIRVSLTPDPYSYRPEWKRNGANTELKGSGVGGDAVSAVWLAVHPDGPAPHVRIHRLWDPPRPIRPQQHQVHGPGGDAGGAGCVLQSLRGGTGVLPRAPTQGVEDLGAGLLQSESADGGGRVAMGTGTAYSAHPDSVHLQLPVPVQHALGVSLPGWGGSPKRREGGRPGPQQCSPGDVGNARCSAGPLHRCHAHPHPGAEWRLGQCPGGWPACGATAGPGAGLPGCGAAALWPAQGLPGRALLQEAARREQGQQGDPGLGDHGLHLCHAHGDRVPGRLHGAGLLPGRGAALLPRSHGHLRGPRLHRADQRLPGHHLLRLYWVPRVPYLCAV